MTHILHNPSITKIDEKGRLTVDLIQLAQLSDAPITPEAIETLAVMVQRYFRAIYPLAECRLITHKQPEHGPPSTIITQIDKND